MSPRNSHDGKRPPAPGLAPRTVRESQSQMAEVVLPNDANPLGNLLGGRLMHMIDIAGAMAAHRHSHSHVVTASMDHIDFREPVRIGDLLILKSSVNRAFNTSMEVGVKCWVENYISGQTRHVASAYLTFVAVDQHGKHKHVPPVVPETDEERRRYEDAGRRRDLRKWEQGSRSRAKG
jgi:acyl-CoA hydrolase